MLAVTILPVLAVPLFGAEPEISGQFDLDILWVIFFFARGHVALTLLLYFDKTFIAITKNHPIRLVVAPLALLLVLPFALMADDRLLKISIFVVFVWNVWHFHRQNLGVLALVSISRRQAPPDRAFKLLANLAAIAGILSFCPRQFEAAYGDVDLPSWAGLDRLLLAICLLAIAGAVAKAIVTWGRGSLSTLLFSTTIVGVYCIVFLYPEDILYFAMAQATAHGLQYAIIVYCIGYSSAAAGDVVAPAPQVAKAAPAQLFYGCIVTAILFLWSLFVLKGGYLAGALDSHMGTQAVLRWVQAFAVTALFAHFVIDGGAFRLREKGQRDWMRARMGAVMSPG
jgi:hypothetical protein